MDRNVDISIGSLEVILETMAEQQYKQQKQSSLKQKASELISVLGKGHRKDFSASNLPQTGLLRIPLSALLQANGNIEFGGKCTIRGFNNQPLGEIILHALPLPGSITEVEGKAAPNTKGLVLYQGYITCEVNGEWQRYWGLLLKDSIALLDIKKRKASSNSIDYADIVKLDMVSGYGNLNAIGMENCLELTFEDGSIVFMYADSELEVRAWADSISKAAWGQPFSA